jgi:hypothetical protein
MSDSVRAIVRGKDQGSIQIDEFAPTPGTLSRPSPEPGLISVTIPVLGGAIGFKEFKAVRAVIAMK